MKIIRLILFALLNIAAFASLGADNDSLFISEVKNFAFIEIGVDLTGDLFTKWSSSEKPYYYVYVSVADKIEKPAELSSNFIFCHNDESRVRIEDSTYTAKGYQTFCYKTYANSGAALTPKFISYPAEARSFIIFHELIHNYITQLDLKIPYELNEALSDVVGNYGTLKYAEDIHHADANRAVDQIRTNEKIYSCINSYIKKINERPGKRSDFYSACQKKINDLLKDGNEFQKDRFNFPVNNAYLLKNMFYSKNYFLLKKVLLGQPTMKDFLEIIKHLPEKTEEAIAYLEKYS